MFNTTGIFARSALLLFASAIPVASSNAQGVGYCFGDPGPGTSCPCNNDNDGSVPGSGCANGVYASGAQLSGSGEASVTGDTLVLSTTGLEPSNSGLYFQANNDLSPGNTWGDGLRCAGGGLIRLGVRFSDATGYSDTSGLAHTVSARSAAFGHTISAGETLYYQCWYRNPLNSPCGSDFNASNGYTITWTAGGGPYDDMALVPAGEFQMGDHSGTGFPNELPIHSVYLDAFYIDIHEVTTEKYADYLNTAFAQGRVTVVSDVVHQYLIFGIVGEALCDTTLSSSRSHITWDSSASSFGVVPGWEEHPMGRVSWYGACTYANGRSREHGLAPCYDELLWSCDFTANGYRLPTEAERECAARGGEHNPYTMYPWGNTIDGSQANYTSSGDPYEGNLVETTPVGYYDGNQIPAGVDMANGYGLYDMSGNQREWCWDWWGLDYYSNSPPNNPTGPPSGGTRVARDGSWGDETPTLRSAYRYALTPDTRYYIVGFRVVVRP